MKVPGLSLKNFVARAPKDHINIRILEKLISGIPLMGPWNQNVRSLCLRGLLGR